jgi:hypothetical protein
VFGHFDNKNIERYTVAFGSIFNDVYIVRKDTANGEVQRLKVPLVYSPKNLWVARIKDEPTFNKEVGIVLPRMAFELVSLEYDAARKNNTMNAHLRQKPSAPGVGIRQFVPVPYNLSYNLYIVTVHRTDMFQILEQILPYFTPDYTVVVRSNQQMGLEEEVPIVIGQNTPEEPEWTTHTKVYMWTINFKVKGNIYGPMKERRVITAVEADLYTVSGPIVPPSFLHTEDLQRMAFEDGDTMQLEADQSNVATATRVERIRVEPNPRDMHPMPNPPHTTTITTYTDARQYNPLTDTDDETDD